MKRILIIALVAVFAIGFIGCGKKPAEEAKPEADAVKEGETTEEKKADHPEAKEGEAKEEKKTE